MKYLYLITFLFFSVISQAQIVDIPDANFKNALLNHVPIIDTNNDNQIQVSEAEVVTSVNVWNKNISSLEGIQYFTLLTVLSCYNNQLTTINLTNNLELRILECYNNDLLSFDLSSNIELQLLHCNDNLLTSLDVSQNINLQYLHCFNNQLTELNIGSNLNIKRISTANNYLINLDISQCSYIEQVYCYNNNLVNLNVKNGNNLFLLGMFSYNNPNLTCIQVDDENATYGSCSIPTGMGWCKDDWAEYSEDCQLGINDFVYNEFKLHPSPTKDVLNIESQQQIESVKIYNVQGQLIKEEITNRLNVSEFESGIYFIQVTIEGKASTKKFIKN